LDDAHLVGATMADDLGGDAGAVDLVAQLHTIAVAQHQDIVELELASGFGFQLLHAQGLALHDAVLLAAGDYYCVHDRSSVVIGPWPCRARRGQKRDCTPRCPPPQPALPPLLPWPVGGAPRTTAVAT